MHICSYFLLWCLVC
uniref:Uncharacterized protein n=1 Tax=Arundo donax TaxID=35708 RepID=A0A0A9B765_ARUDO